MNEKYDTYGRLTGTVSDNIKKGDVVNYIDTKSLNKTTKIKVVLQGVWDGEKVQFDDKDHTLVRAIQWLKLADTCLKCGRKFY
jgi:hypothetical protein